MSCENALEALSTRPATTARIVANATPAMTARNRSPPNVPSPPPRNAARFGAARLPPLPAALDARLAQERARAEADERRQQVEEADDEHRPHDADERAALAFGTVKKRIRMCGRPAVPSTSARPSETVSSGFGR